MRWLFSNPPDSVYPCSFRFHQIGIGENCVRGLIAIYLYSICNGKACWANNDHEQDYKVVEFNVLQRANWFRVLWATVDVLSTNHALLFVKAGALKSSSSLVPVIICICREWKQHFFSESLQFKLLINSQSDLPLIKAKWGFTLLISNLIHIKQKFKWLCFSKRPLTQNREGRRRKLYLIIDICYLWSLLVSSGEFQNLSAPQK